MTSGKRWNERVLEEAWDSKVPVLERLKFLAIVSSNLDEFFMVRVAVVRREIEAGIDRPGFDGMTPSEVMAAVAQRVHECHENIGRCLRSSILPDLAREGIRFITDADVSDEQAVFVREYFTRTIRPLFTPLAPEEGSPLPLLESGALYFVAEHASGSRENHSRISLIRLPTYVLSRFVRLPEKGKGISLMLIDDAIRMCMSALFERDPVRGCFEIKVVRDSELDLDELGSRDLLRSILEGLARRKRGPATRLLYDPSMPAHLLDLLIRQLGLQQEHVFPGARNRSMNSISRQPAMFPSG